MSSMHFTKVTCPHCKEIGSFQCWDSINVQLDPEIKEKVFTGEIFCYTCEYCDKTTGVFFPVLYHDMDERRMIYLVMPDDLEDTIEMLVGEADGFDQLSQYTRRVITEVPLFLEKVRLLEKGYDDKVIELCKTLTELQLHRSNPEVEYDTISFDVIHEQPMYIFIQDDVEIGSMGFSKDIYDEIKREYGEKIADDQNLVIDQAWAHEFLNKVL